MGNKKNKQTEKNDSASHMPKFALVMLAIAIAFAGAFSTVEVKACSHFSATYFFNEETCCIEVTLTQANHPFCRNFPVAVKKLNENGIWEIVAGPQSFAGDSSLTFSICDSSGNNVKLWVRVNWGTEQNPNWINASNPFYDIDGDLIKECLGTNCEDICDECEEMSKNDPDGGWTEIVEVTGNGMIGWTIYKYKIRTCCDETQIKDATITYRGPIIILPPWTLCPIGCSCLKCNLIIIDPTLKLPILNPKGIIGGPGPFYSFGPLNSLFKSELLRIAERIFLNEHFYPIPPELRKSFFDCELPAEMRGGKGLITYYDANCVSLFTALYRNKNGEYELVIKKIDCSETTCCREAILFCYDFEENKPVPNIEYTSLGEPCQPTPLPPVPPEWLTNPTPIWWFRTFCESGCGEDE